MSFQNATKLCLVLAGISLTACGNQTALVPDTAAPLAPQGFHGYVKTEGLVVLKWARNSEPDLAGYNVYQLRPLTKVNTAPVAANAFSMPVPSEDAIFKLTAVDFSGNESAPTPVLRVTHAATPTIDPVSSENLFQK